MFYLSKVVKRRDLGCVSVFDVRSPGLNGTEMNRQLQEHGSSNDAPHITKALFRNAGKNCCAVRKSAGKKKYRYKNQKTVW